MQPDVDPRGLSLKPQAVDHAGLAFEAGEADKGWMLIRPATPEDRGAIRSLICAAFGSLGEAELVEALDRAGDIELSLVAEIGDRAVGHVLFSRVIAPFAALALAPLSVAPEHQGRGIGSALVREGLDRAARTGWDGVFVLGDPDYYERFGFRAALAAGFSSPYAGEHFMALALAGDLPAHSGTLAHAPAFAALG